MLSGDGLVVRLRLSCNEAPLALVAEIADWAQTYGNGLIDLSARGNLQLRGVTEATLPALTRELAEAGVTDASPEAEAVRNVLVAPLAGFDPAAPFDVRPYAKALERELAGNRELWALPGKFGFAFDAGAFPLGRGVADIVFSAAAPDAFVVTLAGEATLGPFPTNQAVAVARQLAQAFLALRQSATPPRRMRDALAAFGFAPFAEATGRPVIPAKAGIQGPRHAPSAPWRPPLRGRRRLARNRSATAPSSASRCRSAASPPPTSAPSRASRRKPAPASFASRPGARSSCRA